MSTRRPAAIQPPDAASTHDRMPARVGSKASSPTNFSPSRSLLFAPRQARDPRRAARGRRDTGSVLVYRLRSASLEFLTARRHAVHGGAEHVQLERLAMYLAGERRADFDSGRWSAMCAEVSRPEARVGLIASQDPAGPWVSGARGMDDIGNLAVQERLREQARALCVRFPICAVA
jgi:hypothetical protein